MASCSVIHVKYIDYYLFTDPEGWKAELADPQSGHLSTTYRAETDILTTTTI